MTFRTTLLMAIVATLPLPLAGCLPMMAMMGGGHGSSHSEPTRQSDEGTRDVPSANSHSFPPKDSPHE